MQAKSKQRLDNRLASGSRAASASGSRLIKDVEAARRFVITDQYVRQCESRDRVQQFTTQWLIIAVLHFQRSAQYCRNRCEHQRVRAHATRPSCVATCYSVRRSNCLTPARLVTVSTLSRAAIESGADRRRRVTSEVRSAAIATHSGCGFYLVKHSEQSSSGRALRTVVPIFSFVVPFVF